MQPIFAGNKMIDITLGTDYGPVVIEQGLTTGNKTFQGYDKELIHSILIAKNTLSVSDTITLTLVGNVGGSPLAYYDITLPGTALKEGVVYQFFVKKIDSSVPANFVVKGLVCPVPFGVKIPTV